MKFTHILMTSSLITITPVTAFAHKVPYGGAHCAMSDEEAAFEGIPVCTQEEKEEAAATAFCNFIGRPDLDNCVQSIINHGMADAAGECVDEALQKQVALKDELLISHNTGGNGGDSKGYWHKEYRYNKENGLHRHDWSEAAREKAGMEYGATAVRLAKESSATNKTTTETNTSSSVFGKFLVGIGFKGIGNVDHEVGGENTKSNGKTTESGPLSEAKVKEIYDKAFSQAKGDPNLTTVSPNIMCVSGEPKCGSSFSRDIPNEDYKPQAQKPKSDQSDGGSGNTSGDQGSVRKPTPPPSKSTTDITPPSRNHEKKDVYAGDPSPVTKPDEMLATYDLDNLNSPVSKCLLESFKKEISKDASKTYNPDGPNLTPEQRKKEAQGLLRNGICDTKYYGQSFCQKHKTMKLTGGQIQDPQVEKSTLFEELQDREKMNFGNPADFQDTKPIELIRRIPKTSPDEPALIGIPGPRGRPSTRTFNK